METQINIAEILKDCPEGTKLYTTLYGEVTLESVTDIERPINVMTKGGTMHFMRDGRYDEYGECILFPSKDQRNWRMFKKQVVPPFNTKRNTPGIFYCVSSNGHVFEKKDIGDKFEDEQWNFGNYFNTREQAEYAAEKVKKLLFSLRKEDGNV